jgi:ABC-type nitrate/sulfonate/bicarbonate transport system substrate-binding protein
VKLGFRVAVALSLVALGCGGSVGTGSADADLTLLLGEPPSGVHAGIFLATARGFDEAEGIDLDVRGAGDPVRLLRRDRVQAVLLDREAVEGSRAVCVMALTQTPEPDRFVCVSRTLLDTSRAEVAALVRAIQRGYSEAVVDPESAVQAVLSARPGLALESVTAELDEALPSFSAGVPAIGFLRRDALPPGDFAYDLVGPQRRE